MKAFMAHTATRNARAWGALIKTGDGNGTVKTFSVVQPYGDTALVPEFPFLYQYPVFERLGMVLAIL